MFVVAAQSQDINQQRHFSKHWQHSLWVTTTVLDEILGKRILFVASDQGTSRDALALSLKFILAKRVSFKVQHAPVQRLKSIPQVTWKNIGSLKMRNYLMGAMCQDGNVSIADLTVEVIQFHNGIRQPNHEEAAYFLCPSHFLHLLRLL